MPGAGRSNKRKPLLQRARADDSQCVACGSPNVMTVKMAFEGSPISVQVCSDCDSRTWAKDGEPVDLEHVLPSMRRTSRPRRDG